MNAKTVDIINNCIAHIKQGDKAAIATLHKAMGAHLRFIALRYFGNDMATDDVIQDFWLNIETYCDKYHFVGNGFNYLARIFDNLCKLKFRREHHNRHTISLEDIDQFEETRADMDKNFRQIALRCSFDKAKQRMREEERVVFALLVHGEMSVRAIAKELGYSKSTVARLRQSALSVLRRTLTEDGWDKSDV